MVKFKKFATVLLSLAFCVIIAFSVSACDFDALRERVLNGTGGENGFGNDFVWEEIPHESGNFPDNVGFYPYLGNFISAQEKGYVKIPDRKILTAYIEFVVFYELSDKINITLTYSGDFIGECREAYEEYKSGVRLAVNHEVSYGGAGNRGTFIVSSGTRKELATKTLDSEMEQTFPQINYALKMQAPCTREEDCGFAIDSADKSVLPDIYSSEQLRWAIQNGYRPDCIEGSPAETVYNKAKAVLREIADDEMSDVEKMRAVYEWLIFNVRYDHYAADHITELESTAYKYDSWYSEGVFNQGKAVCEGYAKALIILAGIEDIPAVFVTGNGHAWNRVFIGDGWYVVDATHGDPQAGSYEQFTYNSFMITDEEKTHRGYTSTDYSDCAATTYYNIYEHITYADTLSTFNLVANNELKLRKILVYAKSLSADISGDCTVDVFVEAEKTDGIETWLSSLSLQGLCLTERVKNYDKDGNCFLTVYLK